MPVTVIEAGESKPESSAPPTPSETIVRAAQTTGEFIGESGHKYHYRKLRPLDRMLIAKALGSDLMTNGVYASYAFVACSVSQINGEKIGMPATTTQVEAMVNRIGDDWDGLNQSMVDTFRPPIEEDDAAYE